MAPLRRARRGTRWDEDNQVTLNPWAFVTVALVVGALAGIAVLRWLL